MTGNIVNCSKYFSPSGLCQSCNKGYKLDSQNQCILICPDNTDTLKYELINGVCVSTDINCIEFSSNDYCSICKNEFYSFEGKCTKIKSI